MQKPKFWKLCVAYLMDVILCQIVSFFTGALTTGFLVTVAGMYYTPDNRALFTILSILAYRLPELVVFVLYFSISEACWGKTLGKKIMGLTVVQAAPQAAPVNQEEETK